MAAKVERARRIRERAEREDRWIRNRARRNLLTDADAYQAIREFLEAEGDPRRVYFGQPPVPDRGVEVLEVRRSHLSKTAPCAVDRWRRFEIPGLGAGRSGRGTIAKGRTWEAVIVDLRVAITEKRAGAGWSVA